MPGGLRPIGIQKHQEIDEASAHESGACLDFQTDADLMQRNFESLMSLARLLQRGLSAIVHPQSAP